jgi:hypothetical protein
VHADAGGAEAVAAGAMRRGACNHAQVLHWPSVFHIFGSLGVAWWALWEWRAASSPDSDPRCGAEERRLLASTTITRVREPDLAVLLMAETPKFWPKIIWRASPFCPFLFPPWPHKSGGCYLLLSSSHCWAMFC